MYTLYFVAVVYGQLTKSPENVAVLVGNNVTLRCAGTVLAWQEYISDPTGDATILSYQAEVVIPNKYDLITQPTGTYDLTIKSIQLNQGGRYRCTALRVPTSYTYAQVITFSGKTLLLFFLDNIVSRVILYLGMYIYFQQLYLKDIYYVTVC